MKSLSKLLNKKSISDNKNIIFKYNSSDNFETIIAQTLTTYKYTIYQTGNYPELIIISKIPNFPSLWERQKCTVSLEIRDNKNNVIESSIDDDLTILKNPYHLVFRIFLITMALIIIVYFFLYRLNLWYNIIAWIFFGFLWLLSCIFFLKDYIS
ncbi:MAG: hypothetical protein HQK78_10605 [Desulfobacterales bacterium]|nr:hypothetical protein [Desulfobacterales bacterium]